MSHVTHKWVMSHINESCHTYEWVKLCVTWLIYIHNLTHSYVWHDSFICVAWLIHMCDMTHLCVTCLIYTHNNITHSLQDHFVRVARHTIQSIILTKPPLWWCVTCVTWLIERDMTHSLQENFGGVATGNLILPNDSWIKFKIFSEWYSKLCTMLAYVKFQILPKKST